MEQKNMKQKNTAVDAEWLTKALILSAVIWTALYLVLTQVFTVNIIPSGSMEGTIMTGDIVIATRYDTDEIDRYDIVVFIPPDDPDENYIKRVIGLPGETILVYDGDVYADGVKLDSSFVPEVMRRDGDGEYAVPEGCYFMMGDNRNHSLDARFWNYKYVSQDAIIAKAKFTIFPFSSFGSLAYAAEDAGQ